MRVQVITAFPYSPHGYDNAQAETGEQDLPDAIAQVAITEGWATAIDETPAFTAEAPRQPLLVLTQGKNVEEAIEALQTLTTEEQLLVVLEGEIANPEYPGGRKGVLAAIDARAEQLKTAAGS